MKYNAIFLAALVILLFPELSFPDAVEYDLTIAGQQVEIQGAAANAITINDSIPGPVLRFTEGDTAKINVHNTMDTATSIHWHGILVPPGMDGVPFISFPPIEPGETFTYEFPIRHSGTYWYHSHSGLQEQQGMYGSIVIEPLDQTDVADREHVVLFSDWTGENPDTVNRTLKRGSEWYAIQKGSAQSIIGAARTGNLGAYYQRELLRMPPMDIADVAYDYFLANGRPEIGLDASAGEKVLLRLVNGTATTYFHVEFAGGPMTIVAADGVDVEPVEVWRLLIAVAETYDVLVTMPTGGSQELRATAHDASGQASVWLGEGDKNPAPAVPYPNLYHSMGHASVAQIFALTPAGSMGMPDSDVEAGKFDKPGMMGMGSMSMGGGMQMDANGMSMQMDTGDQAMSMGDEHMSGMGGENTMAMEQMGQAHPMVSDTSGLDMPHGEMPSMEGTMAQGMAMHSMVRGGKNFTMSFAPLSTDISSRAPLAMDGMGPARPWPPYDKLRAKKPTKFPADKPVREVRLTLDGDMERYVWLLNNKPLSESDVIEINEGEVVRFIMINRTMMHHPMHLHGHFFRVINVQGEHSPLKHTVDVAPMSTTVIEFYGGDKGDWFFHCHLLYHMKAGMARMIHYEGFDPGEEVSAVRGNLYKDPWYAWGEVELLSNMTEGYVSGSNTRNTLAAQWEAGWGKVDKTEWEALLTWERYFNRFFTTFAGGVFAGENSETGDDRAVLGITYLLPLNFESSLWVDSDSEVRVMLDKHFELTPRLMLAGEVQYDTEDKWEGSVSLEYLLHKIVSITGRWHNEFGWGAGFHFRL